jgi:isopentenyl phosphate kinase
VKEGIELITNDNKTYHGAKTLFVKIGGSLVTNKTQQASFRREVAERLADEIANAYNHQSLALVVGHGSGSFGHFAAKQHGTAQGVVTTEQWRGFAQVAHAAQTLNGLISQTLLDRELPIWRLSPSSSALARDGALQQMAHHPLLAALQHGIIPLVYGDVSLDDVRGGTIVSTEQVFFYLAQHIHVDEILLLGEVDGVYDQQGVVIPEITPHNLSAIEKALGGSGGVDVTGGMETKVRDMLKLVQSQPHLRVRILNGMVAGRLSAALKGETILSTLIHAGTDLPATTAR